MQRILFVMFLIFVMAIQAIAAEEDYVIGDGDGLEVAVWGESQLNAKVKVRPDGKITLPGIGDVTATGFTPMALSAKLAEKLQDFVKKPIVTVTVSEITNNKVYVLGGGVLPTEQEPGAAGSSGKQTLSVMSSGVYNLPARTTLLKFLAGLKMLESADLENAYILRNGKKLDVNFYELFVKADLSKDIPLKSEDIIYIPSNIHNRIYVMGAVNTPKIVFYNKGLRILDVILEAGGFTKFARENNVVILRKEAGKEAMKEIVVRAKDLMKEGDLTQNVAMMPGDFVIVKESIF